MQYPSPSSKVWRDTDNSPFDYGISNQDVFAFIKKYMKSNSVRAGGKMVLQKRNPPGLFENYVEEIRASKEVADIIYLLVSLHLEHSGHSNWLVVNHPEKYLVALEPNYPSNPNFNPMLEYRFGYNYYKRLGKALGYKVKIMEGNCNVGGACVFASTQMAIQHLKSDPYSIDTPAKIKEKKNIPYEKVEDFYSPKYKKMVKKIKAPPISVSMKNVTIRKGDKRGKKKKA